MGLVGSKLLVCLPAALFFSAAKAQDEAFDASEMVSCSAHFQARSEWMQTLKISPDTQKLMRDHADILLQAADKTFGPTDWRMFTGPSTQKGPPSYVGEQYYATLAEMTRFAELGHGDTVLPLCVEDEKCIRCTHVLNEIVKNDQTN
jgi:hypothetical protein